MTLQCAQYNMLAQHVIEWIDSACCGGPSNEAHDRLEFRVPGSISPGDVWCFGKRAIWNVYIGRVNVADVIKEMHMHVMVVALQIIGLKATVLILQGTSCVCPLS